MRARSLKPGLFKNEVLGTADPIYTVVFAGLWCMADRAGRLEDRPLRIRGELLPYRTDTDIDAVLSWLENNTFIERYTVGKSKVIQIVAFLEHQNPHTNEAPSRLPSKDTSPCYQGDKPLPPKSDALGLYTSSLTPSSLTPDSGLPIGSDHTIPETEWKSNMALIRQSWPPGAPHEDWIGAEREIRRWCDTQGQSFVAMVDGVRRMNKYAAAHDWYNVPNPASWFKDKSRKWLSPWTVKVVKNKAEKVMDENRAVIERKLAQSKGDSDAGN